MNEANIDKICIAPNSLDAFCQILQFRCNAQACFLVCTIKFDVEDMEVKRGISL
jgi:hypothetical protein